MSFPYVGCSFCCVRLGGPSNLPACLPEKEDSKQKQRGMGFEEGGGKEGRKEWCLTDLRGTFAHRPAFGEIHMPPSSGIYLTERIPSRRGQEDSKRRRDQSSPNRSVPVRKRAKTQSTVPLSRSSTAQLYVRDLERIPPRLGNLSRSSLPQRLCSAARSPSSPFGRGAVSPTYVLAYTRTYARCLFEMGHPAPWTKGVPTVRIGPTGRKRCAQTPRGTRPHATALCSTGDAGCHLRQPMPTSPLHCLCE
ncbi:hypothetical protein CTAM01_04472 [Colletotrichum tamarilloi]|uniref:Uncharacterized protein n=1 Tax=Colletotrichum tamarilloi TaxID=1209934 RepID=A0ABQ9RI98_9PEZI|nr:uncharacterized protein CTAM01_04472 [Colletotrichum tamarilloi]KAK1504242.1 hypothetical protein CTAM01_04472 [Colletotrichum tamarilloi]